MTSDPLTSSLRAPNGLDEVEDYYGWRDEFLRDNGSPIPEWETLHMASARLPEPLHYAGRPVNSVHVHRILVPRFESVYNEVHAAGLWHALEPYGGAYNFRLVRGGVTPSLHSFGAAVDHAPLTNQLGNPPELCTFGNTTDGRAVVRIFKAHGFTWGGDFHGRKDCMHFQFATGC